MWEFRVDAVNGTRGSKRKMRARMRAMRRASMRATKRAMQKAMRRAMKRAMKVRQTPNDKYTTTDDKTYATQGRRNHTATETDIETHHERNRDRHR